MTIEEHLSDRSVLMPLLLIGDESEAMIRRYLDRGTVYVGRDGGKAIAVCVVTQEPEGWIEIKNLAVVAERRRQGIGRAMLAHVENVYRGSRFRLGTGETPSTLRFYESCGYRYAYKIENFFTDNYPEPIIEEGVQLRHMLYLTKATGNTSTPGRVYNKD